MDQTRPVPSLEDSQFHYGFNSHYLQKVVSYWRKDFDWRRQVDKLNQYPHFKTNIEGETSQLTRPWRSYTDDLDLFQLLTRHWCSLRARKAQDGAWGDKSHSPHNGPWLARLILRVLWADPHVNRAFGSRSACVWGGVSVHSRLRLFWSTTEERSVWKDSCRMLTLNQY